VEVWDPKDKKTVLSQIKKVISGPERGLKGWVVCLYPGILLILVFLLFSLLSGCASMKWPWEKEVPMMDDDPDAIIVSDLESNLGIDETANTIACIKLQPECKLD
tara:strand:+ start:1013 stop:1327 length:315 start_codon:yes stop_codon:yes gene_type:complete